MSLLGSAHPIMSIPPNAKNRKKEKEKEKVSAGSSQNNKDVTLLGNGFKD